MPKCKHVRGSCLVPGWGCCKCKVYNGYQRTTCRDCNHTACYETESHEGREAIALRAAGGGDDSSIRFWLASLPNRK